MKKSSMKMVSLMLLLSMCVLALAGCGGKKSDKYTIATDTTFAPFEFEDENGNYVGVDVELLAAIAEDQGFEYELQPLGFDAACAALESGQVDGVIAGMSITDKRKETYDFSEAYYDSGVTFAVKADSTIASYDDLSGQVVAVKMGTEGADYAESLKDTYGFEVKYFDESPLMYQEVLTGNAAACAEDYPVMGYGIANGNGLKMLGDMEAGSSYGFAVQKGKNSELLKMFDEGLKNIRESGKYQEILDKYIAVE